MNYLVSNYTQIPNELFQAQSLDLKAIGLYAYLRYRSYSGNALTVFPSQRKIMKDLKIGSNNTLRKLINQLVENKFLTYKKGTIYTGNSVYELHVPQICTYDTS